MPWPPALEPLVRAVRAHSFDLQGDNPMIRRVLLRLSVLAILVLAPATVRAQDVAADLSKRAGQTIDFATDPALKSELVAAGLVAPSADKLAVTSDVLA